SGYFLANHSVRVELPTSASTTTRSECSAPRASSARPKASRVAKPISRFDCNTEAAPAIFLAFRGDPLTIPMVAHLEAQHCRAVHASVAHTAGRVGQVREAHRSSHFDSWASRTRPTLRFGLRSMPTKTALGHFGKRLVQVLARDRLTMEIRI